MAHRIICALLAFLPVAFIRAYAATPYAGTWDGTTNDLPAVELIIQNDDGRINGSIGFYFQTRGGDGKWHAGEKTSLPLLSPKLEGSVLTFETIHHKKHGEPELGPNNKYRVDFIATKEARLKILKEDQRQDNDPQSGLKLTLRK
jgi:hypothetical protein